MIGISEFSVHTQNNLKVNQFSYMGYYYNVNLLNRSPDPVEQIQA